MGIIDNELLDQLCECVQRNWPGRGIIPGHSLAMLRGFNAGKTEKATSLDQIFFSRPNFKKRPTSPCRATVARSRDIGIFLKFGLEKSVDQKR